MIPCPYCEDGIQVYASLTCLDKVYRERCHMCGGTGDAICCVDRCGEYATHRLLLQCGETCVCDEHWEDE